MKRIEVLCKNCACDRTAEIVQKVAETIGLVRDQDFFLSRITDPTEIAKRGVMSVPAVIVDGKIRSVGRTPKGDEIISWLKPAETA